MCGFPEGHHLHLAFSFTRCMEHENTSRLTEINACRITIRITMRKELTKLMSVFPIALLNDIVMKSAGFR
ncbi:hypothetical protein X798_04776 [Onchocerca flexuosa]|uniref:Uncharacterized protein n=1 Tax=Onchocerca flexuosa TaxID=387005 RepID=A0A238BS87_9BILA|nr:hypothetical protein X798_04776 [Onchocerca flexuosa]